MTPNDLNEYLRVLRENKAAAAVLKLPWTTASGEVRTAVVQVTFEMDVPELPGEKVTPGGWKSPQHLDNPEAIDPSHLAGEYGEDRLP